MVTTTVFHGRDCDPKKEDAKIESHGEKVTFWRNVVEKVKRNKSTPWPLEGKCWENGFYPNVLSQGKLFNHYCSQIFSFLQHNTFYILVLSQSRLLSHCSRAYKFFITHNSSIYLLKICNT